MIFRFEEFELDEAAGELRRGGAPVEIQPKPFELLRILLRERARVVSANELMDLLWPDVAVTPSSLTRAVSHARRAIADTHKGERIRSVARRGYRFVGDVQEGPAREAKAAEPTPAPARGASPFVGREDALAELREALGAALGGNTSVALVTGPAGIGKTRLVETYASECVAQGVDLTATRCRDREGAPAYWTWMQLLRPAAGTGPESARLRELLGRSEELGAELPAPKRGASSEQRRFSFFESVTDALRERTSERPLVLLIEDLQWASSESTSLLEHVAYELPHAKLLIVATVRDQPSQRPLDATLAALGRLEHCYRIELRPFSRREVGELLERAIGRPPPPDLTTELTSRTEGVPLFLSEALRALRASGELDQPERLATRALPIAPQSLQILRRAVDALPERSAQLLEAGAVLGREFSLPLAAEVAKLARSDAADALDAALAAGVVEPVRDPPGQWRFAHALHREAVYERIAPSRRARLHLGAAEALERRAAPELSGILSALSHHHHEALAVGDPERALDFAERAADRAEQRSSWEDAALQLRRGLAAIEHLSAPAPERRLALLLRLGEAYALARDPDNRRATLREASALAASLGRAADQIRAAVTYCDLSEWAPQDRDAEPLLRAALERADAGDVGARAQLVTRLAYRHIRADGPKAAKVAREGLALAREAGEPELVQEAAYVLLFSLAGPDRLAERAALRDEIVSAATRSSRCDTGLIALLDLACDRLMLGDARAARGLRSTAGDLVGGSQHPGLRWHLLTYDAGVAALEGRFAEAEVTTRDALSTGLRARHPYAQGCYNIQRSGLAQERGDWGPSIECFARFAARDRAGWGVPIHWVMANVARARLALGEDQEARALWARLAGPGFEAVPRNIRWTRTVAEIAHLCAELREAAHAEELIALIEPVQEQHAVLPIPVAYGGPLRHALARLQELLGRSARASQLYDEALADAERVGARGWRARILLDAAGAAPETTRARKLAEQAEAEARECGLEAIVRTARQALETAAGKR